MKGPSPSGLLGSKTPGLDFWDRNASPLGNETQGLHLHGNLLVCQAIVDVSHTGEPDHPGSTIVENHLQTGVECPMVEGTLEVARKPAGMESRHSLAEVTRSVGFVHLVDPELALHLVG